MLRIPKILNLGLLTPKHISRLINKNVFSSSYSSLSTHEKKSSASLEQGVDGFSCPRVKTLNSYLEFGRFPLLVTEIKRSLEENFHFNEKFLNQVIKKLVATKNFLLAKEVYEMMLHYNINANDVIMSYLIEGAAAENPIIAFNLMIQSHLNKIVLDLVIYENLILKLKREHKSFYQITYNIMRHNFKPNNKILNNLVKMAQRHDDLKFYNRLIQDASEFNIKIDNELKYKQHSATDPFDKQLDAGALLNSSTRHSSSKLPKDPKAGGGQPNNSEKQITDSQLKKNISKVLQQAAPYFSRNKRMLPLAIVIPKIRGSSNFEENMAFDEINNTEDEFSDEDNFQEGTADEEETESGSEWEFASKQDYLGDSDSETIA